MKNKSRSLSELKNIIFSYEYRKFPYLKDFYGNPYTFIKSKYYLYSSVLLVYILLKTGIKPNTVTIIYALSGVVTGILLSIPNMYCNFIAVFIAFNKGILDWSDGHIARLKYQTSLTGHLLDEYGASTNSIGLYLGIGIFAMHQSNHDFLIYLIPATVFLYGEQYKTVASVSLINCMAEYIKRDNNNVNKERVTKRGVETRKGLDFVWGMTFGLLLDGRARSVDFMLLIILIDINFDVSLSFYVFCLIFLGMLIKFIHSLVLGVRHKWAEDIIENMKIFIFEK